METKNNLNIVLVGMMGAGKSYIGSKLAKLLAHFSYVDTDDEIEKKAGLTISEIFEQYGEKYFRTLESKIIAEVSKNKNQIISVGGGVFNSPDNIKKLKLSGLTFYLKAPAKELFNRIKDETHRPLLSENFSQKSVETILQKREKNYYRADFVINTYQKPAYTILDEILSEYDNYVKQKNVR